MPSLRSFVLLALPLANAVVHAQPTGDSPALIEELLDVLPADRIPDALRSHERPAFQDAKYEDDWTQVAALYEADAAQVEQSLEAAAEQHELKKRQDENATTSAAASVASSAPALAVSEWGQCGV